MHSSQGLRKAIDAIILEPFIRYLFFCSSEPDGSLKFRISLTLFQATLLTCVNGVFFPTFCTTAKDLLLKSDKEPSGQKSSPNTNRLSGKWSPTLEVCAGAAFRHTRHLFGKTSLGGLTDSGIQYDIFKRIYLPWYERFFPSSSHYAMIVGKREDFLVRESLVQDLGTPRSKLDCSSCVDRAAPPEVVSLRSGRSGAFASTSFSELTAKSLEEAFQVLNPNSGIEVRHSLRIYARFKNKFEF